MSQTEQRNFALDRVHVEERADARVFRGHAAVFDTWSTSPFLGFKERIAPGAFSRSLKERTDVLFTFNHDESALLGRTASGTLKLNEDNRGLAVEATLPNTSLGRDVNELISRGDLDGMSFRFIVRKDEWERKDGDDFRTLLDVDLFDVSVVTEPAYADASIDLEARMILAAFQEVREGKVLSQRNKEAIREAIRKLEQVLAGSEPERSLNPRLLRLELIERGIL